MEKFDTKLPSYSVVLRQLGHYLRPYRSRFLLGTFLRLSGDIVYLFNTYAISRMIVLLGQYAVNGTVGNVWWYVIAWACSHTYVAASRQCAKYLIYWVSERVNLDSQSAAFRHLNFVDIAWHEKENTGNKLKRVQNGGEGLKKLIRIWVDNILEIVVNFTGIIIIVGYADLRIGAILILFLFTYLFVATPLNRRAGAAARVVNQNEEDYSGLAYEMLNNVRSVKVMGMFAELFKHLTTLDARVFQSITTRIRRFRFKSWAQSFWAHGFRVLATIVIIVAITNGRYDVGFFVMFNFYFTSLRSSVEELSEISQDITISRYTIARLQGMLAEKITIDDDVGKVAIPKDWKIISLRNVSFSYGNRAVLNNISFDIHRGQKIGIVGLSGAGKSTLFKLLLKEYEDFTGDILFDAVSIRSIKKSSYSERVAAVLQETEVFNFSLKENITLANAAEASNKSLFKKTLQIAHITDFMSKLPTGEDTLIGEKGIKLSGGEKQRLGIARAIFKQPEVLFLDEATSHLDLESEEKIQDSLHHFFKDVTAVVIAHRLTTIQEMDTILLLEGGELLEQGDFKTLHNQKGRFYQLWEKQRL